MLRAIRSRGPRYSWQVRRAGAQLASIYCAAGQRSMLTGDSGSRMFSFWCCGSVLIRFPNQSEGGICLFAAAEGYGFAWRQTQQYRPYERPDGTDVGDADIEATNNAFYAGEPIELELTMNTAAKLRGRVTDDLGVPIPGAKVQVGYVDNSRDPLGSGGWSCRYLEPPGGKSRRGLSFDAIRWLPRELREQVTDENGYYAFDQLPREMQCNAGVTPGPEYEAKRFTIATTDRQLDSRRVERIGYDGELNHEFNAPRAVEVRVTLADSTEPAKNVTVTAHHGRQYRRVGNRGTTNADGKVKLRLPAGDYQLFIEPDPSQPYLFQQMSMTVSADVKQEIANVELQPAAIVHLRAVSRQTGVPVAGVGFEYETESSSLLRPLASQSIYADNPLTDANGELRAFVEPGKRRFVAAGQRGDLLELAVGATTEVTFPIQQRESADAGENQSSYPDKIIDAWTAQSLRIMKAAARITTRMTRMSPTRLKPAKELQPERLTAVLRSLDPRRSPDIESVLKDEFGIEITLVKQVLTADGPKKREDTYYERPPSAGGGDENREPLLSHSVGVFNGRETIHYRETINQVDVHPPGGSRISIASLRDISTWPMGRSIASRPNTPGTQLTITKLGDHSLYEMKNERFHMRQLVDNQTGFVFEKSYGRTPGKIDQGTFAFAPRDNGGLMLPSVLVDFRARNGELSTLRVVMVESVEVVETFPPSAFSVSVPAGTQIVDYQLVPSNGPRRPRQVVLRSEVSDVVAHMRRMPSSHERIENNLKYGQPAPALQPAHWLNDAGETEAPDMSGKVVLIEFWGVSCGPCISQLPQVRAAAQHYADKPFVLIGLHSSRTSVADLQEFARANDLSFQLGIDRQSTQSGWFGETMRSFGVRGIPSAMVIDRDGNLAYGGHLQEALRVTDRLLKEAEKQSAK